MTEEEKQSKDDIKFMKEARKQAMKAYALKEVPIGCVITCEGKVIARGYNRRNTDKNTTSTQKSMQFEKPAKSWEIGG